MNSTDIKTAFQLSLVNYTLIEIVSLTSFTDIPLVVYKNAADFVLVSELLETKHQAVFVFCKVNKNNNCLI